MLAGRNREFLLYDLDLLIAELDHELPWPSSRRRFYHAVLRIYERTDLESFRGDARELLQEELAKDGGRSHVACTETAQCFDLAAQERRKAAWQARGNPASRGAAQDCQAGGFRFLGGLQPRGFWRFLGGLRAMRVAFLLALFALPPFECGGVPEPEPIPVPAPAVLCVSCNQADPMTCGGHPSRCALTGAAYCCVTR